MSAFYSRDGSSQALVGEISLPADKSISHRAILFSAIAEGISQVKASAFGRDNLATLRIIRQLGVEVDARLTEEMYLIAEEEGVGSEMSDTGLCELEIHGKGFSGLREPSVELNCGNSGTTARLLCGVLAGRPFKSKLVGDVSLSRRPFARVVEPLSEMGASFSADKLPIEIEGRKLSGFELISEKASAQVKSAILLAGLQTNQYVSVTQPHLSRNHTEVMLKGLGCELEEEFLSGSARVALPEVDKRDALKPVNIIVPGDFSAAAFFVVAGLIVPGSELTIKDVGFNPTRIGLFDLLCRMGGEIEVLEKRTMSGEEIVDLRVRHSKLKGIEVSAGEVVDAIDEIPILCVAAAFAEGKTEIRGAQELRVKESDRLAMIADLLKTFSIDCEEFDDGIALHGQSDREYLDLLSFDLMQNKWSAVKDHRIHMSSAILQYALTGCFSVTDLSEIETSFPGFVQCFQDLEV